jgi:hypothetical protein
MGLKIATYQGSDNAGETVLLVGGSRLNKGTPTAIPDADVTAVKSFLDDDGEGHDVNIGNAAPKDAEHGSIVVDGKVVGVVPQPAVAEAEAEAAADDDEPTG